VAAGLALAGVLLGLQASAPAAQQVMLQAVKQVLLWLLLGAARLQVMRGPLPPTLQSCRCLQQLVVKPLLHQLLLLRIRRAVVVVVCRMWMSCGRRRLAAAAPCR
jgi:hypothetical protein